MGRRPSDSAKILGLADLVVDENGFVQLPMNAIETGTYRLELAKLEDLDQVDEESDITKGVRATVSEPLQFKPTFGANGDLFLMRIRRPNRSYLRYESSDGFSYSWFRFRLIVPVQLIEQEPTIAEVEAAQNGYEFIGKYGAVYVQNIPSDKWELPKEALQDGFRVATAESYDQTQLLDRHGNHYSVNENHIYINLALPSTGKVYLTNFRI